MSHIYDKIEQLPPDPIFGLSAEFKADPRKDKYTLITGYFRDETLQTPLLKAVQLAEEKLTFEKIKKEYLPIDGDPKYIESLEKLVFGRQSESISGFQTVGATGALYLIGKLATHWTKQIAISDPTWSNHPHIFATAGLKTKRYKYYEKKEILFPKMCDDISSLSEESCVLIHTSCHNPTGLDLSQSQWQAILDIIEKKRLYPILDMAYQGFADTPEKDAFAARLFLEKGIPFALTYTCAKNFSMYGERAGALFVVSESSKEKKAIQSQIKSIIRAAYSNPPMHPSAIVAKILQEENLKKLWLEELQIMRRRMDNIRRAFVGLLKEKNLKNDWDKILSGKGLFFYSEIPARAIEKIRREKGYYIASDSRINLTGLNEKNLEEFVDALSQEMK